jgi:hypothetical protein
MRVLLLILLIPAVVRAEYQFPAEKRGDVTATLAVRVIEPPGPNSPLEAVLTLTVEAPSPLEVEHAFLSDPLASWKVQRWSSWTEADGHVRVCQTFGLEQAKAGVMPLPSLSVRFRDGSDGEWQQVEWADILAHSQDIPVPPAPPAVESHWRRWAVAGGAAVLMLAALGFVWMRQRRRPVVPVPAWTRVLQELEALAPQADAGDGFEFHGRLSALVRGYLGERCELPATQQTSAEFLDAVAARGLLPAETQTRLRELLERCDLVKFAHAVTQPAERRELLEAARDLVRAAAEMSQPGSSESAPCPSRSS